MPFEIITSRAASENHGVKVLVHSRAGMGKTTLCKTAPAPLILSSESGMLALRQQEISTIVIEDFNTLAEVYNWLRGSDEPRKNYQTICKDSISEIAEQLLGLEKAQTRDPRKAYGEMQDKMAAWIRAFRDLKGYNVYMSAKQKPTKDEMSGITLYGPSMPGQQLGVQMPYFFDEVFSLEVGKDAEGQDFRYLRTKTNLQYEAKDRSGMLDEFETPDLTHIFNKIAGAYTNA